MEPQMMSVLFGRIMTEGLEQRRHQSRRPSANRPGIIGRVSRKAFRHLSGYMPRVGNRLIRIGKHYGTAR
jgi:hypothetical protein